MKRDPISQRNSVLARRRIAEVQRPNVDDKPATPPPLSGYSQAVRSALDGLATGASFRVLLALLKSVGGGRWSMVIQAELAIELGIGQGTVSSALETLTTAGMIERVDHNGSRWYRLGPSWECHPEPPPSRQRKPRPPRARKL